MYKLGDEYVNISRILKIVPLKGYLRKGYYYEKPRPAKKKWFRTIPATQGRYVREDFLGDRTEVQKHDAIYSEKSVRVWFDPERVDWWNYGIDYDFLTEEEANQFIETVVKFSEGCKYEFSQSPTR